MSRYRRVNIDGQSLYKTETRTVAAATKPGIFATIDGNDQFVKATAVSGRMYVIGAAEHEGLGITQEIPEDHSAVGHYLEEGREFAVLMGSGTYTKDQPVTVGSDGLAIAIPQTTGTYDVIGYVQDDTVTIGAGNTDFVRIRARASTETVA